MIRNTAFKILFVLHWFDISGSFAQADSTWSVMILKKGRHPEMKDNMAEYSPTGFFLYRNCFYDIQLKKAKRQTLRLTDILQDSLVFTGISYKSDANPAIPSTDTFTIACHNIENIHLVRDWSTGNSKKIKCSNYYFLFSKTVMDYHLDSKHDNVYNLETVSELIPRLTAYGITYHYEYNGKLYYHSGIRVRTPKYSDEEKEKTLNSILTALDFLVNKRVNITIRKKQEP